MARLFIYMLLTSVVLNSQALAQQLSSNPFETPIASEGAAIIVNYIDLARIPDGDNAEAPRLMQIVSEPGTARLFVSTMPGKIYSLSYDGENVTQYIDITNHRVDVMSAGRERGLQSFAFHPQFSQQNSPGYGLFYTYTDVVRGSEDADYVSGGGSHSHDTVLLEWRAIDATSANFNGSPPRELFRAAQPYANHNGGEIAFNPLARPGDADFGLLYIGLADGGSGGDPLGVGQDLSRAFGKILRIDPLGDDSSNGQFGVPADNPFTDDGDSATLGEIYAYGVRNPQGLGWDSDNGRLLMADIGQNQVEEISEVSAGANLGWNRWEGSFRYINRQVSLENPRGETGFTWPIAEYDHEDPLLIGRAAINGVIIYRSDDIPALSDSILFSDIPSGELLYVPADTPANGGQQQIRRILFNSDGETKNLLQIIRDTNNIQGRRPAERADLRFGTGPDGEVLLLNKGDGVIRQLVP